MPSSKFPGQAWGKALLEAFSVDTRSLAAFRIAIGALLLVDLTSRARDLSAHYTDAGVLPCAARTMIYDGDRAYWLSLHALNGGLTYQAGLFIVAALSAAAMMVGYRTRVATVISYVLLASLHSRNPLVLQGGDSLLRTMLFWSMFVPLSARASIDAVLQPPAHSASRSLSSLGVLALVAQLLSMYVFTALFKAHPVWYRDYDAICYALQIDQLATPFGAFLANFLWVGRYLTFLTFWLELLGPLLVVLPWRRHANRVLAVILFIGLHVGSSLTMELGLFPWICTACWLLLIPPALWDSLAPRMQLPCAAAVRAVHRLGQVLRHPERPRLVNHPLARILCLGLFLYVLLWNLRELKPGIFSPIFPSGINPVARVLRVDQRWDMFAPRPQSYDGWYAIEARLNNGSSQPLWLPRATVTSQVQPRPEVVSQIYPNQRWRKYLMNLQLKDHAVHRPYFVAWLRQRWDADQNDSEYRIASLDLGFIEDIVPQLGTSAQPVRRISLGNYEFPE